MSDIDQLEAFLIDQTAEIFHNAMRLCSTPEGLISLLGFLLGGTDYGFRLQLFQLQVIANESGQDLAEEYLVYLYTFRETANNARCMYCNGDISKLRSLKF
jgi:hypothetical protein